MIRVSCPKCKAILQVEDTQAGQVIACSNCKTSLRLPQAPAAVPSLQVSAASSAPASPPPPPAANWHFLKNGQQQGPVTAEQLRGLIAPADLVWKEGLPQWVPASTVPNLLPSKAAPPPPPPTPKEIALKKPTSSLGFLDNLTQKLTEKIKDTFQSVPGPQQQQATPAPPPAAVQPLVSPVPSPSTASSPPQAATSPVPSAQPQAFAEVKATYRGGHPDFSEVATGSLQMADEGIEFTPNEDAKPKIKVIYAKIANILEPQKGEFPASMLEGAAMQKKAGSWLGYAAGMAGAAVPDYGGVVAGVGKTVAGSVKENAALGPPPKNRLTVVMLEEGVKYRILFDMGGATREELEAQAQTFWNKSAKVRGRFGKSAASTLKVAAPTGEVASSQVNALKQLKELLDLGILSQEEFDQKKAALLSQTETQSQSVAQGTAPLPVIVGCPKCQGKIRAKQPGIIQCPKCQTKIRVDKSRFEQ